MNVKILFITLVVLVFSFSLYLNLVRHSIWDARIIVKPFLRSNEMVKKHVLVLKKEEPTGEVQKSKDSSSGKRDERDRDPDTLDHGHPVWKHYRYDPSKITIIQFTDMEYASKYLPQMRTVRCYAELHGYSHEVVDPNVLHECNRMGKDFFHKQLCALHHIMTSMPDVEYFIKVDGDVIGGTSKHSLEYWLEDGADMVMFERWHTAEFNAGFYGLRNTEAARYLLKNWYESFWKQSGRYFNGNDNGSIHMAVADALQIGDREKCWKRYASGLNGSLASYFEYVACVRGLIGPPRRHHRHGLATDDVNITIWPALFGPMMDATQAQEIGHSRELYPLHHGIKDYGSDFVEKFYGKSDEIGRIEYYNGQCIQHLEGVPEDEIWHTVLERAINWTRPNPEKVVEMETLGSYKNYAPKSATAPVEGLTKCFIAPGPSYHHRVPRFDLAGLPRCAKGYMECQPLDFNEFYNHDGYRCVGHLHDNLDHLPMFLVKVKNKMPHYDEDIKLLEEHIDLDALELKLSSVE